MALNKLNFVYIYTIFIFLYWIIFNLFFIVKYFNSYDIKFTIPADSFKTIII